MVKLFCILLFTASCLSVNASAAEARHAATASVKTSHKCTFPKSRKRAPAWICNKHAEGLTVTALGFAPRSRAGISFMEQMALADARSHLVQEMRIAVEKRLNGDVPAGKAATGQSGELLTRITDQTLQGTTIEKRANGPHGSLYVLVGLDEANANRLIESVTAEYRAQQHQ